MKQVNNLLACGESCLSLQEKAWFCSKREVMMAEKLIEAMNQKIESAKVIIFDNSFVIL